MSVECDSIDTLWKYDKAGAHVHTLPRPIIVSIGPRARLGIRMDPRGPYIFAPSAWSNHGERQWLRKVARVSCISFLSPEQRATLGQVTCELSPDEVRAAHPMPPVTAGTLRRIRLMATSPDPQIRAAAASKRQTPPETLETLGRDADLIVRSSVARNDSAAADVLRRLGRDASAQVRGWVAANRVCPTDVLDTLADDPDETVRKVVTWARAW